VLKRNIVFILLVACLPGLEAQYIAEVMDYTPAPGQFINTLSWGFPGAAVSIIGDLNGSLCLGAFGGSVVFRFDEPVENHPDNPYGVDFTIFGNPMAHWAEPGVVWVMKDENGNNIPDDSWYELAGSDYHFSSTVRDYSVTYTNPGGSVARDVPWTDGFGNNGVIKANRTHPQPYYPLTDSFPAIPSEWYTLTGTLIKGAVEINLSPVMQSVRRAFGYTDNQLRGAGSPFIPDNPYTSVVENSGGDAFDIGWAVDREGQYVDLDRIHFIKVQNGMLNEGGWLGEVSTEISGAVDVPPDPGLTGILDLIVIRDLPWEMDNTEFQLEVFVFHMGRLQEEAPVRWSSSVEWATVDGDNRLRVSGTGPLTLTASMVSNPEIRSSVSTTILSEQPVSGHSLTGADRIRLFPNPATEGIRISGSGEAMVSFFDPAGKCLKQVVPYHEGGIINVTDLPPGIYLVGIDRGMTAQWLKLFKK
jgi:hypothetical protein